MTLRPPPLQNIPHHHHQPKLISSSNSSNASALTSLSRSTPADNVQTLFIGSSSHPYLPFSLPYQPLNPQAGKTRRTRPVPSPSDSIPETSPSLGYGSLFKVSPFSPCKSSSVASSPLPFLTLLSLASAAAATAAKALLSPAPSPRSSHNASRLRYHRSLRFPPPTPSATLLWLSIPPGVPFFLLLPPRSLPSPSQPHPGLQSSLPVSELPTPGQ